MFTKQVSSCCHLCYSTPETLSFFISRPTFRYFTWHTCVLGIVGCGVMMFLINAIYTSASIAFMLLLLLLIHYLSPTSSWGYISQALIFHQVHTNTRAHTNIPRRGLSPGERLPSGQAPDIHLSICALQKSYYNHFTYYTDTRTHTPIHLNMSSHCL